MTTSNNHLQSNGGGEAVELRMLRGRLTCSVDEAARALGIGRSTAFKAVHDGSLPALRISNRILISVPRLLTMLGCQQRPEESGESRREGQV